MKNATALILSHGSALEYWRSGSSGMPTSWCSQKAAAQVLASTRGRLRAPVLHELLLAWHNAASKAPLDLLTSSRNDRRTTKLATIRCVQPHFPDFSFIKIPKEQFGNTTGFELYVSSPELCFVQMAGVLSTWDLIELGYELCGGYSRERTASKGYVEQIAASTPERLLNYAASAVGVTGAKQARAAAKWVIADSRSPGETHASMLAHLPRSLGGMGAKAPLLNQSIPAPEEAARILGSRTCTPDLYWQDAHVVVEYDTRAIGDRRVRAEYDQRKRNAYRMMGIDAISISRADLSDPDLIRGFFEHINRRCGKRLMAPNSKQVSRQNALLEWLAQKEADFC